MNKKEKIEYLTQLSDSAANRHGDLGYIIVYLIEFIKKEILSQPEIKKECIASGKLWHGNAYCLICGSGRD